jgi:hypothetical protein
LTRKLNDWKEKNKKLKQVIIHIASLVLLALITNPAFSQLEASGDTTICQGGQAQLSATGDGASYYWTSYPTDPTLLIPQQQNPLVSPQVTTMYVVQSNIATGNLILNGSFELGVMGFNSEYINNQVSIMAEGTYAVVNDAHTVHPNFFCNEDHTTGSGKFMAINGAGVANVKVWYLNLTNVQPNRRYEFSTWITSLHETNPATLQFSINGELMGLPFQAYPYTCDWYQFFYLWDSEENDEAMISIVNQNTILSGNDFALDDISFATVLVYYDTVWVEVLPQFDSPFESPLNACSQEPVTVTYTGNAPDTAIFNWDFGSATVLSGSGPGPYEIMHNSIGNNTLSLWVEGDGCTSDTTVQSLVIGESPLVAVSADETILPYGDATVLHGSWTGGIGPFTFAWNHPELLLDPNSTDPQTTALEFTTEFIMAVTDQAANCTGYDTVLIQVAGGPLGVSLQADPAEICAGEQSVLTAQGLGGTENYTYSWTSLPPGFTSDLAVITIEPLTTTQYTVTISDGLSIISEGITVTVFPNPMANAGPDQFIPYGTSTGLQGTGSAGSGNYGYRWEPSSLVVDPNSALAQTLNLEITTPFYLTITDLETGCISLSDEVIVQIEGGPLAVTINPSQPTVCSGNEVTLTAYTSGGNEGNYTYAWTSNPPGFSSNLPAITVQPLTTTQYTVTINDGFNIVQDDIEIIVYPGSEFTWSGMQDVVNACPYDSIILKPDPQPADWQYLWSNGSVADHITVGSTGIGFNVNNYTLTTTSPNGCTFSDNIQVVFDFSYCFGIDENKAGNPVKIIPNPNPGKFRVEISEQHDFDLLSIYNSLSVIVFEKDISGEIELEINLANLPEGLYFVALKGTAGLEYVKVLITR